MTIFNWPFSFKMFNGKATIAQPNYPSLPPVPDDDLSLKREMALAIKSFEERILLAGNQISNSFGAFYNIANAHRDRCAQSDISVVLTEHEMAQRLWHDVVDRSERMTMIAFLHVNRDDALLVFESIEAQLQFTKRLDNYLLRRFGLPVSETLQNECWCDMSAKHLLQIIQFPLKKD